MGIPIKAKANVSITANPTGASDLGNQNTLYLTESDLNSSVPYEGYTNIAQVNAVYQGTNVSSNASKIFDQTGVKGIRNAGGTLYIASLNKQSNTPATNGSATTINVLPNIDNFLTVTDGSININGIEIINMNFTSIDANGSAEAKFIQIVNLIKARIEAQEEEVELLSIVNSTIPEYRIIFKNLYKGVLSTPPLFIASSVGTDLSDVLYLDLLPPPFTDSEEEKIDEIRKVQKEIILETSNFYPQHLKEKKEGIFKNTKLILKKIKSLKEKKRLIISEITSIKEEKQKDAKTPYSTIDVNGQDATANIVLSKLQELLDDPDINFGVVITDFDMQSAFHEDIATFLTSNNANKIVIFMQQFESVVQAKEVGDFMNNGDHYNYKTLYYSLNQDFQYGYSSVAQSTKYVGSNSTNSVKTFENITLTNIEKDFRVTPLNYLDLEESGIDYFTNINNYGTIGSIEVSGVGSPTSQKYFLYERKAIQVLYATLQVDKINLMTQLSQTTKISQTEEGASVLRNQTRTTLRKFINNGFIGPGRWNSSITLGPDPQLHIDNIEAVGFFVYQDPVDTLSQQEREEKKLPITQIAIKSSGAVLSTNDDLIIEF